MTGLRAAVAAGVCFVLLALAVAAGATTEMDVAIRDTLRPGDVWGEHQLAADVVVEGLRPVVMVAVLLTVGAAVSLLRRSWAPLALAGLLVLAAALPALAVKAALHRTDPHHELSSAGSFPSGHVLLVLVGLGGMLLVAAVRTRWWHWLLVGAATSAMAVSLVVQAAHWSTDALGGALLGVVVLGSAHLLVRRGPAAPLGGRRVTPPRGTSCTPPRTDRGDRVR